MMNTLKLGALWIVLLVSGSYATGSGDQWGKLEAVPAEHSVPQLIMFLIRDIK